MNKAHPLTVWCLYRSTHPRGYTPMDRVRVLDSREEAEALRAELQAGADAGPPLLRHWFFVAPQQCEARLWLLMYQECYESAVVIGIYRSRRAAESARHAAEAGDSLIGGPYNLSDLFIEEDLLL